MLNGPATQSKPIEVGMSASAEASEIVPVPPASSAPVPELVPPSAQAMPAR